MDFTDQSVLERQIRIEASPQTVYSYFTDPVKMVMWKGVRAQLDPRPGGIYRVEISENTVVAGKYIELIPYEKVVFSWGWEGADSPVQPGASTVEITLIPDDKATIVVLRHLGLPAAQIASHAQGWDHFLPRLAMASEGMGPGRDPWSM